MSAPRRLFFPTLGLGAAGAEVRLSTEAAHHARVLRLAPGAPLVLFDGAGREADAVLLSLDEGGAVCRLEALRQASVEGPRVVLCPMLPKAGKLDDVVRATTELGVVAVHPVLGARSVARPDPARALKQTERLRAIAREAARQSGRADVPDVEPPASLAEVAARPAPEALRVVLDPRNEASFEQAASSVSSREIWLVTGPEGGLTDEERALLRGAGFLAVGLGPTVLRAETAAVVAVALAAYALGGLRPRPG